MKKIFFQNAGISNALRQHETIRALIAAGKLSECSEAVLADIVVVASAEGYANHRRENDSRTFLFVSTRAEAVFSKTVVGTRPELAIWLSEHLQQDDSQ